eukprot:CAMPEP_0204329024 /NCGR_PEP_ID=MMETSP0469-20131031/13849_1 /ASSEMBLY_ACC=CAM_ASM_000384 /TAXON_ID=2969 /ORGANISM="Oxyrrhis marina" /LENGTH=47 /DNA_ID= /DNA_START= /DNA_END= /DNA_ORIENTATION=
MAKSNVNGNGNDTQKLTKAPTLGGKEANDGTAESLLKGIPKNWPNDG